ncbi:MAG: cell wall-binding repeat-containing protein [Eubacterium sp.]|nr:cell wall-binding repeat-containing protein [Eubacterium sp.]
MSTKYVKRLTAPEYQNMNWLHSSLGGYNNCIKITSGGECIPNCVGYAWGRWRELLGYTPKLSLSNAEDWYGHNDGYQRGSSPRLGAVMCWKKGAVGYGGDGAGHVAIVESIGQNGEITVSASDYGSRRFYTKKYYPPFSNSEPGLEFMGFIYPPVDFVEEEIKKPMCNLTVYKGRDRYETAERVRQAIGKQKYVNVNGENYADGISAAHLARKNNASIIFDFSIDKSDAIYQLGNSRDSNITAIVGSDRFLTNLEALKVSFGNSNKIIVTSGLGWGDGISATSTGLPIMLVDDFVNFKQLEFLSKHKGLEITIIGGTTVIPAVVEKQLKEFGTVKRLWGENRYETSALVAKEFFPNTNEIIMFELWGDGVVASQIGNIPILLVDKQNTAYAKEYLKDKTITKAIVVGSLDQATANDVISK